MDRPKYIDWIIEEIGICIKDDLPIKCYKINYSYDDSILDDWALHIRRHYVSDESLAEDVHVFDMEVEDYLREYVIPQKHETLGATVRSGDIAEIIVADLLEFIMGYSVPRYKQMNRSGKNNSEHGTDVIAYRFKKADKTPTRHDELIAAEVKAKLTDETYTPIESAVKDSKKDALRLARTVNHCRKRLQELGLNNQEKKPFFFKSFIVSKSFSPCSSFSFQMKKSTGSPVIFNLYCLSSYPVIFINSLPINNVFRQLIDKCFRAKKAIFFAEKAILFTFALC